MQDYMDAPFPASGAAQQEVTEHFQPPFFQWWDAKDTQRDGKTLKVYEGWKVSVEAIRERISSSGPYDGVLGFSQVLNPVMATQQTLERRNKSAYCVSAYWTT